jgi:hypothetical protein
VTGVCRGIARALCSSAEEDISDMQEDEAMTCRAIKLLGSKRNDAYEAALTALREDTQAWWAPSRRPDTDVAAEDDAAVVAMA